MACCCSYSRLSLILGRGNIQDGETLLLTPAGFNARGDIAQCIGMEHECRISNNAAHRMVYLVDGILSRESERLG